MSDLTITIPAEYAEEVLATYAAMFQLDADDIEAATAALTSSVLNNVYANVNAMRQRKAVADVEQLTPPT